MRGLRLGPTVRLGSAPRSTPIYPVENVAQKECVASGWGRLYGWGALPDQLQFIRLKTLLIEDCRKRWGGVPVSECEICTLTQVGVVFLLANARFAL
ncbi:Trypsin [Popillia japonica]|uniref:Trypsin n=1 Tax=Popillia japonica TaxID=7064 RepID=A0AAW1NIQ6_POPJA